ncbi:ribosylnicotinamide kinase [Pseudocyphellaria aurata]|nr:ribosylnicotinamide kinase [Pseudocyphellaria aurata]
MKRTPVANQSPHSPPATTATSPSPTTIFLVGISGPSSAGKTTLAHLLRYVFAPYLSLILHGDDFCKEISLIPTVNGYVDADGINGVDFSKMVRVLDHIKSNAGAVPDDFASWQRDVYPNQGENALKLVPSEKLDHLKRKVEGQLTSRSENFRIVVIEGFMLYNVSEISQKLDLRLFVRLDYREAKRRRMTRPLYGVQAKPGEFWKTEDYFDKTVWRNYVEQHQKFFECGDVEGRVDQDAVRQAGVSVLDGLNVDLWPSLEWAVEEVLGPLSIK